MSTQKNISFSQSVKSLFKNWNVFAGTCSRKEFWYGQIFLFFSFLMCLALLFVGAYVFELTDVPRWIGLILLFLLINLCIFLEILGWTQFVRRYHDVGLSGQFYWFNIISGGLMADSLGSVFNGFGFALFMTCYVIASLPSKKFRHYK